MTKPINSLSKAVEILRLVATEQGVSLPTVMKRIGLPKSTTHRLLANLERTGLVQRMSSSDGVLYALGPLVNELASGFAGSRRLVQIARPVMEQLRDACDETVLLHVFEGASRVVLDQVESRQELRRTYPHVGVPVPIHSGAASKVFLASLTTDELRRYWSTFPAAVTRRGSATAFRRYLDELQAVRRQGYAISVEELTTGVTSIAMGIEDADNRVIACVSVTGPASRLSVRELKRNVRPHLAAAVEQIARALRANTPNKMPALHLVRRTGGISSK